MTMKDNCREWSELTSSELETCRDRWIIVPMAQIEGHGRYLPVGTDKYIVEYLARMASRRLGSLVGPTISLGNCFDFEGWTGYVTVSNSIFMGIIRDYTTSLLRQGFARILYLLNHRGHNYNGIGLALDEMRLSDQADANVVLTCLPLLTQELLTGWEGLQVDPDLSLMMLIRPDLVHPDGLVRGQSPEPLPDFRLGRCHGGRFGLARLLPDGIPTAAPDSSAQRGRQLVEACIQGLRQLLEG